MVTVEDRNWKETGNRKCANADTGYRFRLTKWRSVKSVKCKNF